MNPQLYTHTRVLAPEKRADREEAQMISRLADKAVALAREHGEVLTHKQALSRARENYTFVKIMAMNSR